MVITPPSLIRTVKAHYAGRPQALLVNMANSFRSGLLDELVSELRSGISDVHHLAQLSYRHELGFTKLTVGEFPDMGLKVRLHVWRRSTMPDEANIHNHRFAGYSFILHGHLTDTRWRAHTCPGGIYLHYRYEPRLNSSEYTLKYVGRASLEALHVVELGEGETYGFSNEDLHTTEVTSASLLTLFIEDRRCLRSYADVFAHRYPAAHHRIAAPALTDEHYLQILEDTAHSLLLSPS